VRRGSSRGEEIEDVARARPFRWLVRFGFVARGLTYGIIGALSLALAFGAGTDGTKPNQQGALELITRAPLGFVAVVAIAIGLLAYASWKLLLGIKGRGPEGGGDPGTWDRVGNAAGGVAYLVFFAVAVRVLVGSAGNSSKAPRHAAAGVLGWPAGRWLVGAGGVVLIAVSAYQIWDAVTGRFASEAKQGQMEPGERETFLVVGRVGLVARALVFAVCGYFLARTAIAFNPKNAVGVDGALARLHHQPLGPWIVGLVGVGLLVFAVHSLFEARYRRL
jgi:hypothetical protein